TPGTHDDIALFEWFEDFGGAGQRLLGVGERLVVRFPLGVHELTLRVTDRRGMTSLVELTVAVTDTTPPTLTVSVSPSLLWPPTHRMVDITARITAADVCSTPTVMLVSVTSNEPDDAAGGGDGTTLQDIQGAAIGTADTSLALRAERAEKGSGRVYTLIYAAT